MSTPKALLPALRQYRHNNDEGLLFAYDKEETEALVLKQQKVLDALIEAADYVVVVCDYVPEQLTNLHEDKQMKDLIEIKKVARQMIKFAKARLD